MEYQRFTQSACKDIGIEKSEFAWKKQKTQFLVHFLAFTWCLKNIGTTTYIENHKSVRIKECY